MTYMVKEIFYTLQGEGANTGRPAVFLRFAGCNLWSGREQDRASAVCSFCDTDFIGTDGPGGGLFDSPEALCLSEAGGNRGGVALLNPDRADSEWSVRQAEGRNEIRVRRSLQQWPAGEERSTLSIRF